MALIKSLETQYGNTATYWKIIMINQYLNPPTMLVDLVGFVDQQARLDGKTPIHSLRFHFAEGDHPLSELDPALVIPDLLDDWVNFDQHLVYQHIKAIAKFADARLPTLKEDEQLTSNEQIALNFVGSEDRY